MTAVSLFAGIGGFDLALERNGVKVVASVEIDKKAQDVLRKQFPESTIFGDITGVTGEQFLQQDLNLETESSLADFLAKTFSLLASEQGYPENAVDYSGKSADSLTKRERKLLSSKTCRVYFQAITEQTWPQSLKRWSNAGIASHGGCLMLNTLEFPSDAKESLLSDVLETQGDHLKKYSLSAKAAEGILRRANRREKTLPAQLQKALEHTANHLSDNSAKE